jgi:hypothetical protein
MLRFSNQRTGISWNSLSLTATLQAGPERPGGRGKSFDVRSISYIVDGRTRQGGRGSSMPAEPIDALVGEGRGRVVATMPTKHTSAGWGPNAYFPRLQSWMPDLLLWGTCFHAKLGEFECIDILMMMGAVQQVVYAGDHRMSKLPRSTPPLALYLAVPAPLPGRLAWMAPLRNTTPVARGECAQHMVPEKCSQWQTCDCMSLKHSTHQLLLIKSVADIV